MSTRSVVHTDNGTWKVLEKTNGGQESTKDEVAEIDGMDDAQALAAFQGYVSEAPNKRRAAVSLLCNILHFGLTNQPERYKLDMYRGKGDAKTGQLDSSLKTNFLAAENDYFQQFMDEKHPLHKSFISRLPKTNERGDSLDKDTKALTIEQRFDHFKTATRKDPSYSANKNLVLNFLNFVGQLPYTDKKDGRHITPPEIMRVLVANAKNVTPPDTSYETKLIQLLSELVTPADPNKPVALNMARADEVLEWLSRAEDAISERLNMHKAAEAKRAKPGDVVDQTKEAMEKANAKVAATAPGKNAMRVKETH